MSRPTPTPPTKRVCGQCRECVGIANFNCAWLDGFGNDRDQPDQTSCAVTLIKIKDQLWVCVIEMCDNGLRAGKDLIMDTANKLNLPIVVYKSKIGDDYGDYLILTSDQKILYSSLFTSSIGFLDNDKRLEIFLTKKKKKKSPINLMSESKTISYIVVQASGIGSRMRHLTSNKPKTILSVFSEPILISTMRLYPHSHFIILGHYQFLVLKAYLVKYAPHQNYTLIKTKGSTVGNNVGIKTAIKHIPPHTPFMVLWCDLYHQKPIDFSKLDIYSNNYLGLSKNFKCRWQYYKNRFNQKRSSKYGVAGIYIFSHKKILSTVPQIGEFCQYLQTKQINFIPFPLQNIKEIGTLNKYNKILNSQPLTRPFNYLKFNSKTITKIPTTRQGIDLAQNESNWYQTFKTKKWEFLPHVFQYSPLCLERISGQSLYLLKLSTLDKEITIQQIIQNLNTIHTSLPNKENDYFDNNLAMYITKTKHRLDSIASIVPKIKDKYITINQKKCINYYQSWSTVEEMLKPYFTNIYVPIHGDCTFSNTIYNKQNKIYFIDPRGYFGQEKIFGDVDYDWAKLYYSLVGNYDQFNNKKFKLLIKKDGVSLKIESNGYHNLAPLFWELTKADPTKIKLLHAIIWLSLSAYSWDDYDAVCGAFYQGIYLLNQL